MSQKKPRSESHEDASAVTGGEKKAKLSETKADVPGQGNEELESFMADNATMKIELGKVSVRHIFSAFFGTHRRWQWIEGEEEAEEER